MFAIFTYFHVYIKDYSGKMPSKYCFVSNRDKFRCVLE